MDKDKFNLNTDWEITLPFRILEVFIFLMFASFLIRHPWHVNGLIPANFKEVLELIVLFGLFFFFIISAWLRIRHKQTSGAFLVVDYAIVGSGGFFLLVMFILLIIR